MQEQYREAPTVLWWQVFLFNTVQLGYARVKCGFFFHTLFETWGHLIGKKTALTGNDLYWGELHQLFPSAVKAYTVYIACTVLSNTKHVDATGFMNHEPVQGALFLNPQKKSYKEVVQ